jgi:Secretion system C-terminal sorting domain
MRGSAAKFILFVLFLGISHVLLAQTTVTSGNWNDPTVWSGGAVPAAGGTVNVNNPLTINTNLSPTGVWTFNSNATDQQGGTAYFFNPNAGTNTLTISSGVTVTFEGGGATQSSNGANCTGCNQFSSGTINISGTLILASTLLTNSANLKINILASGTLIINGDLVNKNNSGTFAVNGALIVNGNFDCATGSVAVGGTGTIDATGGITSNGGSTIFGTTNDCTVGPCSGTTLNCTFTNTVSPTSKVICSGSTTGTLTATTNGATPTYLWESSTTSSSSGFATAAGTSTASTYTSPAGLVATTWYRVAITSGGCTSRSAAVKITVLAGGGWIGTTNNWGTASNWCSGSVPINTTDVVINAFPSGSGLFMPVILSGTNAVTRSVTINSGASITVNSGGTLSLSGDFTNNGTFTDNSSVASGVSFVGTGTQTIAGTTANTFNNLAINNSSGLTPAVSITTNNVTVASNLVLTTGLVNLNGYTITLGTTAGSAGTLAYTAGRFYGGNIERWFPTSSITIPAVAGLFPIGTSTDYRPIYFGNGVLTVGGVAIKVRHTSSPGATAVAPTFTDNGGTVAIRSNSFWTVTTNGTGTGTGTHAVRTEGTGFGTVGNVNDLRITRINTISPGSDGAHAGTLTNPQVNRTGISTTNLSGNYYWGSINAVQTPLPIELLDFTAKLSNAAIDLRWTTASELNNDFFTIERLNEEDDIFIQIGAVKGSGTINEIRSYQVYDFAPRAGKNYYRLKQTDLDGQYSYSKIVMVDYQGPDELVGIYPNPTTQETITIEVKRLKPGQQVPVQIRSTLGVQAFSKVFTADSNGNIDALIRVDKWAQGLYLIQIGTEKGIQRKIIIE